MRFSQEKFCHLAWFNTRRVACHFDAIQLFSVLVLKDCDSVQWLSQQILLCHDDRCVYFFLRQFFTQYFINYSDRLSWLKSYYRIKLFNLSIKTTALNTIFSFDLFFFLQHHYLEQPQRINWFKRFVRSAQLTKC